MALLDFSMLKISPGHRDFIQSPSSPFGKLWAMDLGWMGVISALFYAFLQTGFSEELLFRVLIGRKLIARLGWMCGNIVQAFVFAAVHILLLWGAKESFGIEVYVFSFVVPFLFGLYAIWLNSKSREDSIVPSIFAHGLGNFLVYLAHFSY